MQVEAKATKAVKVMEGRVQELAMHTEAQRSRFEADVTQRLESEIGAVAMSTATTAEARTREAMEGRGHDVQS